MLTDIGKWARPAISSHAVQWNSIPHVGRRAFTTPNKAQMRMPLQTHAQQYCGAPDADFRNPIPRDLHFDMPVATEHAMGTMGLVRVLSQGC